MLITNGSYDDKLKYVLGKDFENSGVLKKGDDGLILKMSKDEDLLLINIFLQVTKMQASKDQNWF